MSTSRIDVLITAYNAAPTIEAAIGSILAQSLGDFRVIVVDDGSDDGTRDLVRQLAEKDRRIALFNRPRSGIVNAANFGLQVVQAPYLARMDADDLSEPDRFEHQVAILEAEAEIVAVSGAHDHIDVNGRKIGVGHLDQEPMRFDARRVPQRAPYLPHPFLIARTSAMDTIGRYYRHFAMAEDVDLYWRLQEIGQLHNTSKKLGSYRIHQNSATAKSIFAGRVAATYSQLSGVSAYRRAGSVPDIEILFDPLNELDAGSSLEQIVEHAARGLLPEEKDYLSSCAAAKLLELLAWRSYEPDWSDYQFIGRWLTRERVNMLSKNHESVKLLVSRHLKLLLRARKFRKAFYFRRCVGNLL